MIVKKLFLFIALLSTCQIVSAKQWIAFFGDDHTAYGHAFVTFIQEDHFGNKLLSPLGALILKKRVALYAKTLMESYAL